MTKQEFIDRTKMHPTDEEFAHQINVMYSASGEISEINSIIEKVHPENGWKKTVVLHGGHDEVAITSHPDMNPVRDQNGDPMTTICDPQLFELMADYFNEKKNLLLEEVCAITSGEGGEE